MLWEDATNSLTRYLTCRKLPTQGVHGGYYDYVELSYILQASVLHPSPLLTEMLRHHENRSESGEQAPSWRKQLGGGGAEVTPTPGHNL